jgi:hypothetical protein
MGAIQRKAKAGRIAPTGFCKALNLLNELRSLEAF